MPRLACPGTIHRIEFCQNIRDRLRSRCSTKSFEFSRQKLRKGETPSLPIFKQFLWILQPKIKKGRSSLCLRCAIRSFEFSCKNEERKYLASLDIVKQILGISRKKLRKEEACSAQNVKMTPSQSWLPNLIWLVKRQKGAGSFIFPYKNQLHWIWKREYMPYWLSGAA